MKKRENTTLTKKNQESAFSIKQNEVNSLRF